MSRRTVDVLRHEAGHMVVAKVLGFKTDRLVYKNSHAGAKLAIDLTLTDIAAVTAFIRRRVPILYAGVLAESLNGGKVDNDKALKLIEGPEGADDYSKARELIRVLAGIERGESEHQLVLDKLDNEVWNKATSLVEKYEGKIDMLSRVWREKLGGLSEFELSGDEISSIPCFKEIETGSEC
jgi:hypothetical protein